jgi:hypothetical protein
MRRALHCAVSRPNEAGTGVETPPKTFLSSLSWTTFLSKRAAFETSKMPGFFGSAFGPRIAQ